MKKTILGALLLFLMALGAQAQNIMVHGTVLSATDSEPLIGASVVSAALTGVATTTDIDGNFTLSVPDGSDLTISYIGFKTKTVKAAPS